MARARHERGGDRVLIQQKRDKPQKPLDARSCHHGISGPGWYRYSVIWCLETSNGVQEALGHCGSDGLSRDSILGVIGLLKMALLGIFAGRRDMPSCLVVSKAAPVTCHTHT